MKHSIYQGKGINFPASTLFISSIGKCGHNDYRELQVYYFEGSFNAIITDGYKYLTGVKFCSSIKEALNWFNTRGA